VYTYCLYQLMHPFVLTRGHQFIPIIVQPFIPTPVYTHSDVREQAAWALGNVAGDSVQCRDLVLSLDALPALLLVSQVMIVILVVVEIYLSLYLFIQLSVSLLFIYLSIISMHQPSSIHRALMSIRAYRPSVTLLGL